MHGPGHPRWSHASGRRSNSWPAGRPLTQAAANLDWPVVTTSNVVANALRKVHRYARLYAQVRARDAEAAPS